ncbi:ComEC/Rec2 family competence protein [Clostridium frigidicarnis]|uniref:Competence protein ComEC n=1 Tax=Clostridium frigidicarnis TaxID=84698 RepID=A0A1I0ZEA3_9CLOT|nr:MBL fold metallo-hydrolase [Clostridium frigidicarnis]SFB22748.1 competence protein ComEC [Clostridium frigidicarnis]
MKKSFKCLLGLILMLSFIFVGCNVPNLQTSNKETVQDKLLVHYIDVGQGDSILIQSKNKNLLIDAGPRSSSKDLINYLKKNNIKKLDYVIATHPHEDHIGGMADVINTFEIGEFYAPKKTHTTKTYENMVKALQNKKLKIIATNYETKSLDLGDEIIGDFLAPVKSEYDNLNNYSTVLKVTCGDNSFLFTGDAEKDSEKEILQKNIDVKADVIKLGHHGSSTSSSNEFLDKVNPSIAVASLGKGNDYGHPHKETIDKMKNRKITFYRTDELGTIVLSSDGKTITKK